MLTPIDGCCVLFLLENLEPNGLDMGDPKAPFVKTLMTFMINLAKKMAIEKKKNATAACDILQRFSEPCVMLLWFKYSLFLQECALIPTASTAPAVNINTKFKKSSVASMIGQAKGSKTLANSPYIESVVIPYAAANIA